MEHSELEADLAGPVEARPSFAHHSEAELARILDFYQVRWRYEPDTFPIGWTLEGDVIESFAPDFYLPDVDLYVELTTLKQKLVRKKNRKLRRLRALYPDVRIKLFYARDFRMLLLKFGRLALIDELSGTTGQATPPRDPVAAGAGPGSVAASVRSEAGRAEPEHPAPERPDPTIALDEAGDAGDAALAPMPRAAATLPSYTPDPSGGANRGRRRGRRRRSGARTADRAAVTADHGPLMGSSQA